MSRTKSAEAKPRATRMYIVREKATGKPVALINAQTVAQVRNHQAALSWDIGHASQSDVFEAAKAGLEPTEAAVEGAGEAQ